MYSTCDGRRTDAWPARGRGGGRNNGHPQSPPKFSPIGGGATFGGRLGSDWGWGVAVFPSTCPRARPRRRRTSTLTGHACTERLCRAVPSLKKSMPRSEIYGPTLEESFRSTNEITCAMSPYRGKTLYKTVSSTIFASRTAILCVASRSSTRSTASMQLSRHGGVNTTSNTGTYVYVICAM